MTALAEAEAVIAARIAATVEPEPAETLFMASFFLGTAMWPAWARYWRL